MQDIYQEYFNINIRKLINIGLYYKWRINKCINIGFYY